MGRSIHGVARIVWCALILTVAGAGAGVADEPSLDAVPVPEDATLEFSRTEGRETLHIEYRIPLADGLTVPQVGDRVIERAQAYLGAMEQAGWNLITENWHTRQAGFTYRNGVLLDADLKVHPAARPMEGKMRNFVAYTFELRRRLPYEDNFGHDPVDVPRYPGSVRVRYMNLLGDFATKYLVQASLDDVRSHFETKLSELGWEETRGVGTLNYRKGGWTTPDDAEKPKDASQIDPIKIAENAIPSTLGVHLRDNEGLIEIGLGRAAGAPDVGKVVTGPMTPEFPPPQPKREILTRIDPAADLPVYPGLERTSRRVMPINLAGEEITRIQYEKTDAETQEALAVADFYLDQFDKRGWTLEEHEWYGIGRRLLARKDAVKLLVQVQAVGLYPIPERAPRIRIPVQVEVIHPIPSRDIAGKDIEGVPRYEGSKRFYYLKAGIDQIVKFKAVGSVPQVERFFLEELPKNDWMFAGNDDTGLLFVPASTAQSAAGVLASGQLVPTTLKVKVDNAGNGTVKIGMDLSKGG